MISIKRSFPILIAGLFFIPLAQTAPDQNKSKQAPPPLIIKKIPQIPETDLIVKVGKLGGITQKEYDEMLEIFAFQSKRAVQSLDVKERKKILDKAIDDEILFQAALADGALNDKKYRSRVSFIYKAQIPPTPIDITLITEKELKNYYDAHQNEFLTPQQNLIKAAFFSTSEKAWNFTKKLKDSKNPGAAPEWENQGWFVKGQESPEHPFEECYMAFLLKKGEFSNPFYDSKKKGFQVFYCVEEKPGTPIDFEKEKAKIRFIIAGQKQEEHKVSDLKEKGFDPQKMTEDDAFFLEALKDGTYRGSSVKAYAINSYILKKKQPRKKLLPQIRQQYPVTILHEEIESPE